MGSRNRSPSGSSRFFLTPASLNHRRKMISAKGIIPVGGPARPDALHLPAITAAAAVRTRTVVDGVQWAVGTCQCLQVSQQAWWPQDRGQPGSDHASRDRPGLGRRQRWKLGGGTRALSCIPPLTLMGMGRPSAVWVALSSPLCPSLQLREDLRGGRQPEQGDSGSKRKCCLLSTIKCLAWKRASPGIQVRPQAELGWTGSDSLELSTVTQKSGREFKERGHLRSGDSGMAGALYWFPLSLFYKMLMVTIKFCWAFANTTHLRCAVRTPEPRFQVPAIPKGRNGKPVWMRLDSRHLPLELKKELTHSQITHRTETHVLWN